MLQGNGSNFLASRFHELHYWCQINGSLGQARISTAWSGKGPIWQQIDTRCLRCIPKLPFPTCGVLNYITAPVIFLMRKYRTSCIIQMTYPGHFAVKITDTPGCVAVFAGDLMHPGYSAFRDWICTRARGSMLSWLARTNECVNSEWLYFLSYDLFHCSF